MDTQSKTIATIIVIVCIALVLGLGHLFQTPCPKCGKRGTLRWDHAKGNGEPDRRFKTNARRCASCGAVVEER